MKTRNAFAFLRSLFFLFLVFNKKKSRKSRRRFMIPAKILLADHEHEAHQMIAQVDSRKHLRMAFHQRVCCFARRFVAIPFGKFLCQLLNVLRCTEEKFPTTTGNILRKLIQILTRRAKQILTRVGNGSYFCFKNFSFSLVGHFRDNVDGLRAEKRNKLKNWCTGLRRNLAFVKAATRSDSLMQFRQSSFTFEWTAPMLRQFRAT